MTVKEKPVEAKGARVDRSRKNRAEIRTDPDINTLLHRLDEGITRVHAGLDGLMERMGTQTVRPDPPAARVASESSPTAGVTNADFDALLHRLEEGIAREHVAMDRLLERMTSRLPR